jgi:hypothetical protein
MASQPRSESVPASQNVNTSGTTTERIESMMGFRLNKMPWYITGVINDLPAKDDSMPTPQDSREGQRSLSKLELDERARMLKEIEAGRAADRALREVLSSLSEARCVSIGNERILMRMLIWIVRDPSVGLFSTSTLSLWTSRICVSMCSVHLLHCSRPCRLQLLIPGLLIHLARANSRP